MKNPTPENVAQMFNVPVANVKRQYARNAIQLRQMAAKAGNGKYRGKTAEQWGELAAMAELKSQPSN